VEEEAYNLRSAIDYFKLLARVKYVIYLDTRTKSAGQLIAESSIFGIIAFGYQSKLFQRLLFPDFTFVANVEEVFFI
jgi:hypothetical protein